MITEVALVRSVTIDTKIQNGESLFPDIEQIVQHVREGVGRRNTEVLGHRIAEESEPDLTGGLHGRDIAVLSERKVVVDDGVLLPCVETVEGEGFF